MKMVKQAGVDKHPLTYTVFLHSLHMTNLTDNDAQISCYLADMKRM